MGRPLSIAERKKVAELLERGNTPLEISKQIPFVGLAEIRKFAGRITTPEEVGSVRMSVSLAYFEFPDDPPERLARRLGYGVEEVKRILRAHGLPWREVK